MAQVDPIAVNGYAPVNRAQNTPGLLDKLMYQLSQFRNELEALRKIKAPVTPGELQQQYSELLSQIMGTLQGSYGQPGLINLIDEAYGDWESGTGSLVVRIFVSNNAGIFSALRSDLEHGNIGKDSNFATASQSAKDLSNFLTGVIDQDGENFLNTLLGDVQKLDPNS